MLSSYFNLVQQVADSSNITYSSIRELTIDIAQQAGYRRAEHTCKNGKTYIKTFYDNSFDNVLVAKWLMFYKNFFIGRLYTLHEYEDYYSEIIWNTFYRIMSSLQIDKLVTDSCVTKLVELSLNNRICEAEYEHGSVERLKRYNKYKNKKRANAKFKNRVRLRSISKVMTDSLDKIISKNTSSNDNGLKLGQVLGVWDVSTNDIRSDIERRLGNDDIGRRLLNAMLNNGDKKIQPSHIDDFVYLERDECTTETKEKLSKAWYIIEETLREYLGTSNLTNVYKWHKPKTFKYSFEKAEQGSI